MALIASTTKPTTSNSLGAGEWAQYTTTAPILGGCKPSGGEQTPINIPVGTKVWGQQPTQANIQDKMLVVALSGEPVACALTMAKKYNANGDGRFAEVPATDMDNPNLSSDPSGDDTNGTNGDAIVTQYRTSGFGLDMLGEYKYYIIGGVVLVIAWRMGFLKKLMPKK
jgi:hypothetical protein